MWSAGGIRASTFSIHLRKVLVLFVHNFVWASQETLEAWHHSFHFINREVKSHSYLNSVSKRVNHWVLTLPTCLQSRALPVDPVCWPGGSGSVFPAGAGQGKVDIPHWHYHLHPLMQPWPVISWRHCAHRKAVPHKMQPVTLLAVPW